MNVNSVSTTNNNTHNDLLHESLELEEAERDKICHATIKLQKQINNVEQEIESLSNLMIDQESLHKTKLSKLLFGYFPSHPTNYSQLLGPVRVQETETTVGDYDIGPLIGDGNYAKVHIGHHRITKQEYALKIIPKRQLNDLRILQNLEAELHILQFVDHPNLVSFTTLLHAPDHIYVIMQRAHKDLYYFMYEATPTDLTMEIVRESIVGILLGLEYLHLHGIAHMDIKPENVLVTENVPPSGLRRHHIQLCDFGLGEVAANPDDIVPIRKFVGTPGFFAPEIAIMKHLLDGTLDGRRADMWSLGCTIVELTQGLSPEWMNAYNYRTKSASWMFKTRLAIGIQELNGNKTMDQDLVRLTQKLLVMEPKARLTVSDCLVHKWIRAADYNNATVSHCQTCLWLHY